MPGAALAKAGIGFPIMGVAEGSFWMLPGKERMVLIAAHLCDKVHVKEIGANRGLWVERMLAAVGLGGGFAWCASFVSYCAKLAEFETGPKSGRAAVRNWASWAKDNNLLGFKPTRGDLVYRLDSKTKLGHIGIIIDADPPNVKTIEGNTDGSGSREGDGVYRKSRQIGATWKVIRT